jgi:hypothetical protein
MVEQEKPGRDLAGLVAPLAGRLVATGDRWEPFRLVDADGKDVGAAGAYFGHLQAAGRVEPTVRSSGPMAVMRTHTALIRHDARTSLGSAGRAPNPGELFSGQRQSTSG